MSENNNFNNKDYFFLALWFVALFVSFFSIGSFYQAVKDYGNFTDHNILSIIIFPVAVIAVIVVLYFGMQSLTKFAQSNIVCRSLKSKLTEALECILQRLQNPSPIEHRHFLQQALDFDSFDESVEHNAFEWKRRFSAITKIHQKYVDATKNLICDNQGWLANYLFEISEGHKTLKDKLHVLNQMENERQQMIHSLSTLKGNRKKDRESKTEITGKISELSPRITALSSELIRESDEFRDSSLKKFQDICEKNYEHLTRLLFIESSRKDRLGSTAGKKQLPRMTIKGFNSTTNETYDLCRMPRFSPTYEGVKSTSDNSAFEHIRDAGKYFICNDIPSMAGNIKLSHSDNKSVQYQYMNPRLINELVRKYSDHLLSNNKPDDDSMWIDCWSELETEVNGSKRRMKPPIEACYRSTLVIPITLLNNDGITDAFKKHFGIPLYYGGKEKHRAIWGAFCLDHIDRNYFVQEVDISLGYCFADILSLYHIGRLTYTEYSSTMKIISGLAQS